MTNVSIVEVGARDGLQNEKHILSTKDKLEFIRLLSLTGLKQIEITSFVRPSAIPQMGDSIELFKEFKSLGTDLLNAPCLVPNLRGYENAKKSGVEYIALFSATSDTFTKKNINCTVNESFDRMKIVANEAKKDKKRIRGYISTAFGCPYEKDVPVKKLIETIEKMFKLGVDEVSIGDTIGIANPKQVQAFFDEIKGSFDLSKIAMHFHDTRNLALTNIYLSYENGIRTFDSSAGGLGGCPYAKGASGNVATEDVIHLFESIGVSTGVNLEKVSQATDFVLGVIKKPSPSKIYNLLKA